MNQTETFCRRLIDSCEKHSQKTAMHVVGDESESITFGEFLRQIRSIAYRLEQENVGVGDRVALIGENHPCWATSYLGVLYRGAVCVPMDPHGEIETITNFFEDSEAKVAFLAPDVTKRFHDIEERLGRSVPAVVWRNEGSKNGFESFEDWSQTEFPASFADAEPPANPEDNAILIYTSGTTGKPKGVLLTHGNITAELDAIDQVLEFTDKESVLSLLPLFHVYLQIVNLWLSATKGAEVYYLQELTPDELSKGLLESKMSCLASVPRLWYLFHKKIFDAVEAQGSVVKTLFRGMLRLNGFTRDYFGLNLGKKLFKKVHDSFGGNLGLAVTAGSRFDEDVAIDFYRLGFNIVQGYGLSETSGAATATYADDNRVGSVGKPMLGAEVKLDEPDENGEGEVLIRGSMVFQGYYKNPEATKAAFTEDGWFRSGDIGKFDKDGHLYIVGRAKDVIVLPSGKNVHPEDLEVHYSKCPIVGEICVLGIEDRSAGHKGAEKLIGVVVPDFEYLRINNIANSREAIRFELDNLGRELPEYERVRDYIVRSEPIPRTATRKIKRFELLKEIKENGESESDLSVKKEWIFTETDRALMESRAGQALAAAIIQQKSDIGLIHPEMNLEIDLRLDSLARAEILASLEQSFGFEFVPEEATKAFSAGDLINLVQKTSDSETSKGEILAEFNWQKIVKETEGDIPEIKSVLKKRPIFTIFAYLFLKCVYLFSKIFLRLEVKGIENLQKTDAPFLICPNHQSFLDPFIVCSAYPYRVLAETFHVGASEYFNNFFTRNLARFLKVVPIDADRQILKAMKAGAIGLKNGKILNIYPEGERAFDGELHPFKKGAAILATELDMPIIPVALDGMDKVWGRESNKIRFAKVKIEFGRPLIAKDLVSGSGPAERRHDDVTKKLKSEIAEMIKEMRRSE
ncbi:MAG: AMP-binding protein [Acidobacteria bacterium]|nr:AMP-binding protein [Acidobacteriota bacterium]